MQLTAVFTANGTSFDVTTAATWTSSAPAVARVDNGLVTMTALGTTEITVGYQQRTANTTIAVTTGGTVIAGCGEFSGSGTFTLDANIPRPAARCVTFTRSSSAMLDCRGHDAGSVLWVRASERERTSHANGAEIRRFRSTRWISRVSV